MWTILKFENKSIETLKKEFSKVLGKDCIIYMPKLFIQKYKNNKLIEKEFNLLGAVSYTHLTLPTTPYV